jgi:O-antigen ligase
MERIKSISNIFHLAFLFLTIYIFFRHTNFFFYFSIALFLIFHIIVFTKEKMKTFIIDDKFLLTIFLFFVILILNVVYSSDLWYSLSIFVDNYFFGFIIMMSIYFYLCLNLGNILIIFRLLLLTYIIFLFFLLYYVLTQCSLNVYCYYKILVDSFFYKATILRNPLIIIQSGLLLILVISLASFLLEKSKRRFLYLFLTLISLSYIMILSRRACLLGLGIGFFIVALRFFKDKDFRFKLSICLLLLSLIFIFSIFIFLNKKFQAHFLARDKSFIEKGITCEINKVGSLEFRLCSWKIQLKHLVTHNLILGSGLGMRLQKEYMIKNNLDPMKLGNPHNTYINIWMQSGFLGLVFFMIFLGMTLKKAFSLINSKCYEHQVVGISFTTLWIAYLVLMMFFGIQEGPRFIPFWITAGIIWEYARRET